MKEVYSGFIYDALCACPSCHASSIAVTRFGACAAWFAGSRESGSDVRIYTSVLPHGEDGHQGGCAWSTPVRVESGRDEAHWNPVLFADGDTLVLTFKSGAEIVDWQTCRTLSADGGYTWSAPEPLQNHPCGDCGPAKNPPLRLPDGRLLAGGSHERGTWRCFIDESDDLGATWRQSDYIYIDGDGDNRHAAFAENGLWDKRGLIQPTLWRDGDGVHCLMRSTEGKIYRSDEVGGKWCAAYPTELPNNNSGICLAQSGDRIFLAYNPVGENWGARTPLTLAKSRDKCKSFTKICDLASGEGGFAYPTLCCKDNMLYVSFTWNRLKIYVKAFDITE